MMTSRGAQCHMDAEQMQALQGTGATAAPAAEVDFRRNRSQGPPRGHDTPRSTDSPSLRVCRFPCAIVWQPFPPLTWLLPMAGHTGITDSRGVVHDFQGPYTVVEDSMMLGRACRYLPLDASKVFAHVEGSTPEERWDKCIENGDSDFRKKIHCLLYPNCNHHVAHCLNCLQVGRSRANLCQQCLCPMPCILHACFFPWLSISCQRERARSRAMPESASSCVSRALTQTKKRAQTCGWRYTHADGSLSLSLVLTHSVTHSVSTTAGLTTRCFSCGCSSSFERASAGCMASS